MAKLPTDSQWQDLANRINGKNEKVTTRITGNSNTFTTDIHMLTGQTGGFIHQFVIFVLGNNVPLAFLCHWTKNQTYYQTKLGTDNTTMTFALNSTNETTGTANITFNFSRTIYGGISVLSIG